MTEQKIQTETSICLNFEIFHSSFYLLPKIFEPVTLKTIWLTDNENDWYLRFNKRIKRTELWSLLPATVRHQIKMPGWLTSLIMKPVCDRYLQCDSPSLEAMNAWNEWILETDNRSNDNIRTKNKHTCRGSCCFGPGQSLFSTWDSAQILFMKDLNTYLRNFRPF